MTRHHKRTTALLLVAMLPSAIHAQNSLSPTGSREQTIPPQTDKPLPATPGEKCLQGGKNALYAAAILTGVGCAVDLFISGGVLCLTTYIPTAVTNAATAAAAGCAVASPSDSASVGVSASNVHLQLTN